MFEKATRIGRKRGLRENLFYDLRVSFSVELTKRMGVGGRAARQAE